MSLDVRAVIGTQALEAMEAAFADWYQANVQQAGAELVTHEAWQAGWTAALAWKLEQ